MLRASVRPQKHGRTSDMSEKTKLQVSRARRQSAHICASQHGQRRRTHSQILDQVVEHAHPLRVLAFLHVRQRADLRRLERDVVVADPDLELLPPDDVLLRPCAVSEAVLDVTDISCPLPSRSPSRR